MYNLIIKAILIKRSSNKIGLLKINSLQDEIRYIIEVFAKGYVYDKDIKKNIKEVLLQIDGSNTINLMKN